MNSINEDLFMELTSLLKKLNKEHSSNCNEHLINIIRTLAKTKQPKHSSNSSLSEYSDSGQHSSDDTCSSNLSISNHANKQQDHLFKKDKQELIELLLQLITIVVQHFVNNVQTKKHAQLLLSQWQNCSCASSLSNVESYSMEPNKLCSSNSSTDSTDQTLTHTNNNYHHHHHHHHHHQQQQQHHQETQNTLISDSNQLLSQPSSGVQSDSSDSPIPFLNECCLISNFSSCFQLSSCCLCTKCNNVTVCCTQNSIINSSSSLPSSNTINSNESTNQQSTQEPSNPTLIPPPPPPPPPMPMSNSYHNALDKSISNSSLNNHLLLSSSFTSNLSNATPPSSLLVEVPVILLETPKPRSKMKTLNWNKIPVNKVLGTNKPNLWSMLFCKENNNSANVLNHNEDKDAKNEKLLNILNNNSQNNSMLQSKTENSFNHCSNKTANSYEKLSTGQLEEFDDNNNENKDHEKSILDQEPANGLCNSSSFAELDFDTLEGLFCQPNNNCNNSSNVVGTLVANYNNVISSTGSTPNSSPNSPRSNRRFLQQQTGQTTLNNFNTFLQINSNSNASDSNANQMLQSNFNANNLINNYLNAQFKFNYQNKCQVNYVHNFNNFSSNSTLNPGAGLEMFNSSPYSSLDRKSMKRSSGEYNSSLLDYPHNNLLDSKRTLNINIFLKQFRSICSSEGEQEILRLVRAGDHSTFGAEKLMHLIKLLPDQQEIKLLNAHSDEINRLPLAERFLLQLMVIPRYKLRLECMLLKEEYKANFAYLNPSLDTLINAAKELENCRKLHEVLYLILITGNFLNSGGYAGDAAGFKMMSLLKLSEIRANKPGISLIHYVALQANKKQLSGFITELSSVEKASKISLESLKCDINSLANKIFKIKQQINCTQNLDSCETTPSSQQSTNSDLILKPNVYWKHNNQLNGNSNTSNQINETTKNEINATFFEQMHEFLADAEKQIKQLTRKVETDLEQIRTDLGEFLCEEAHEFKLEECFRIFSCFLTRFKIALEENSKKKEIDFIKINNDFNGNLNQQVNQRLKFANNLNSSTCLTQDQINNFNNIPHFKQNNSTSNQVNNTKASPRAQNSPSFVNLNDNSNQLDPGLVEFLSKANELNGNAENLIFNNSTGSFRRVGSGRRSLRQLNTNVFANNEIDYSSRERLNIGFNNSFNKIAEEDNFANCKDLKNKNILFTSNRVKLNLENTSNKQLYSKENTSIASSAAPNSNKKNSCDSLNKITTTASALNISLSRHSSRSLSRTSLNNSLLNNNHHSSNGTLIDVITPTRHHHHNSINSSEFFNETSKLLERAQSQLSLSSLNKNKIRSNPLTPSLQHDSLNRLNCSSISSNQFHNYSSPSNSTVDLRACVKALESLTAKCNSFSKTSSPNSTLTTSNNTYKQAKQAKTSSNNLRRNASDRLSLRYSVSSKVDCHNTMLSHRTHKESFHNENLLDKCKYILPKTSEVTKSTLNRTSILRMSLNRKNVQQTKTNKNILDNKSTLNSSHYPNATKSNLSSSHVSPIRISTTSRPINLNPKKSLHLTSYIEPSSATMSPTENRSLPSNFTTSNHNTKTTLARVNSFRTASTTTQNTHPYPSLNGSLIKSTSNRTNLNNTNKVDHHHSTSLVSSSRTSRWAC